MAVVGADRCAICKPSPRTRPSPNDQTSAHCVGSAISRTAPQRTAQRFPAAGSDRQPLVIARYPFTKPSWHAPCVNMPKTSNSKIHGLPTTRQFPAATISRIAARQPQELQRRRSCQLHPGASARQPRRVRHRYRDCRRSRLPGGRQPGAFHHSVDLEGVCLRPRPGRQRHRDHGNPRGRRAFG